MKINKKGNVGVTTFLTLGISSFYLMDSSIFFGEQKQVILQNQENKEVKKPPQSKSLIDRISSQVLGDDVSFDQWFQTGEAFSAFDSWKKSYDALKVLIPEFKKEKQFNTYASVWLRQQKDDLKKWKRYMKKKGKTRDYFSSWSLTNDGFNDLSDHYQGVAETQSLPIHNEMTNWIKDGPKKRDKATWINSPLSNPSLQSWVNKEATKKSLEAEWKKHDDFKNNQKDWLDQKNKKPLFDNWKNMYGLTYYQKWIPTQTLNKTLFDLWKKTPDFENKATLFIEKGRYQKKRSLEVWKNTPYLWQKNFEDYVKTPQFLIDGTNKFLTTKNYEDAFEKWKKDNTLPFDEWIKSSASTPYFNSWAKEDANLEKIANDGKYGFKISPKYSQDRQNWINTKNYKIQNWYDEDSGKNQFNKWVLNDKNSLLQHWATKTKHYQTSLEDWIKSNDDNIDSITKKEWLKTDDGTKHFTTWVKKPSVQPTLIEQWKTKGKANYESKLASWIAKGPQKRTFTKWSQNENFWNTQYEQWKNKNYDSFLKTTWEEEIDGDFVKKRQAWLNLKPKRTKQYWVKSSYITSYYNQWKKDGLWAIKNLWKRTVTGPSNFLTSQNNWINEVTSNRKNIDYWFQNSNHKDGVVRNDHSFNEEYAKWYQEKGQKLLKDDFATNQLDKFKTAWLTKQGALQLSKTQWSNHDVSTPVFVTWINNPEFKSSAEKRLQLWKKDLSNKGYSSHLNAYIRLKSGVDQLDFRQWKIGNTNLLKAKWITTSDFKTKLNNWLNKQTNIEYSNAAFLKWGQDNSEEFKNLWLASNYYHKAFEDYKTKNRFLTMQQWLGSTFFTNYWNKWKKQNDNAYILNEIYKKGVVANKYKDLDLANSYQKALTSYGDSLLLDALTSKIKTFSDYNKYFNDWNKTSIKYLRSLYLNSSQYQKDLAKFDLTRATEFKDKRKSGYVRQKIAELINQNSKPNQVLYSNNEEYKKEFYAWLMPHLLNIKNKNKVNIKDAKDDFVDSQKWGETFYKELINHLENTINNPLDYFRVEQNILILNSNKKLNFHKTTYRIITKNDKETIQATSSRKKFPQSRNNSWYRFGENEDNKFIISSDFPNNISFAKNFLTYIEYAIKPLWAVYWDSLKLFDENPNVWRKRVATTFWSKVHQLWKNQEYDPSKIMDALDIKTTKKQEIINKKVKYENHIPQFLIDHFWSINYQVMDGLGDGPTGSTRNSIMFDRSVIAKCFSLGHIEPGGDPSTHFYDTHHYNWNDLIKGHKSKFEMMEILSFMNYEKFKHLAQYHDPTINRKWKQKGGQEWLDREIPKLWSEFKTYLSGLYSDKNYDTPYSLDIDVNSEYSEIGKDSKWEIPSKKMVMIRYDAINEFENSQIFKDWKKDNPDQVDLHKVKIDSQRLFNLYQNDALNKLFVKFYENKWLFNAKRRNDANRAQNVIKVVDEYDLTSSQITTLENEYNNLSEDQLKKEKYRRSPQFNTNFNKWITPTKKEEIFKNLLYVQEEFFKSLPWKEELFNTQKLATSDKSKNGYFAKFKPYQDWFNKWFSSDKPILEWSDGMVASHNDFTQQLFRNDHDAIENAYLDWKTNKKLLLTDFEKSSDHTTSFNTWKTNKDQGLKEWFLLDVGKIEKAKQNQEKYLSIEDNWKNNFNSWVDSSTGGVKYFEEEVIKRQKWTEEYESSLTLKNALDQWSKIKKNILPDFFDQSTFFPRKLKEYNDEIAKEYNQKYFEEQYQKDFDQYWNQIVDIAKQINQKQRFFLDKMVGEVENENIYLPWFKRQYQQKHYQDDLAKWIKAHPIELFAFYKSQPVSTRDYNKWIDPQAHKASDFKKGLKQYDDALKSWVDKMGTKHYLQSEAAKQDYSKWIDPLMRTEDDYNGDSSFNNDLQIWATPDNVGAIFLEDEAAIDNWKAFNVKIKADLATRFKISDDREEYFQKWIDLRVESWDLFIKKQSNIDAFNQWLSTQYHISEEFKDDLQKWITKDKVLKIYEKDALKDYQNWEDPLLTKTEFKKDKSYDDAYDNYLEINGEAIYINSSQATKDYQNWKDPLIRKKIDYELNPDFYQDDFVDYYLAKTKGFEIGYQNYNQEDIKKDYDDFENEYVYQAQDFIKSEQYQVFFDQWLNDFTNTKPLFAKDDASTIEHRDWIDPLVRTKIKFRDLALFKESLTSYVLTNQDFLIENLFIDSLFMTNIYEQWSESKWEDYWDDIGFTFEPEKYLESPQAQDDIIEWLEGSFEKGREIFKTTLYAQNLFRLYRNRR